MDNIFEFSQRLVNVYHPQMIILFGSYAYGEPNDHSDVDLLVIMPFEGNPFDRSTEMLRCVPASFSVDLIVRQPDDTNRRYREYDPLIREALDRGKVLYERDSEGMDHQSRRRLHQRVS